MEGIYHHVGIARTRSLYVLYPGKDRGIFMAELN